VIVSGIFNSVTGGCSVSMLPCSKNAIIQFALSSIAERAWAGRRLVSLRSIPNELYSDYSRSLAYARNMEIPCKRCQSFDRADRPPNSSEVNRS